MTMTCPTSHRKFDGKERNNNFMLTGFQRDHEQWYLKHTQIK